jgi:hypothetical protein
VALTYDKASGVARLYCNGVIVAQQSFGSFTPKTTGDLHLGRRPIDPAGSQYTFSGLIDEPAIYNRALASDEIAAIYNAGAAGKCTGTSSGMAPVITMQPTNQTVSVGSTASFSVTATGSPTLYYQWYGPGESVIVGAINPTLTLSNVQPANAGAYFVLVSNLYGFAISSNAVLTVTTNSSGSCTPPPAGIVGWWRGENNALDSIGTNNGILDGSVGFGPGEVGSAFIFPGTNGNVLIPANSNLDLGLGGGLTLEAWISPSDVSIYDPIFEWNADDGVTYWGVHLYVIPTGTLYADVQGSDDTWHQIQSASGIVSSNSFQHVALTYDKASGLARLYRNGVVVAEQTFGSFTPKTTGNLNIGSRPTDPANQHFTFSGMIDEPSIYNHALASNEIAAIYNAGSAGKCTGISSGTAPVIITQPTNQMVAVGDSTSFSVTATGIAPLDYQWWHVSSSIPGATNSTLTLTNVQLGDAGAYFVVVSNADGSVTSSNAALIVIPSTATVLVVNTSAPGGSTFDVPIVLVAKGNENALSFSLSFDPSRLVYSDIALGSAATNGLILPNVGQSASGKIGVQLALPSGETFNAGSQEIVRVTFTAPILTGTQAVVTAVSFTDQPIARLVSDAQSQPLADSFIDGTVTLSPTALEGDAIPIPSGDGNVDLFDWVQVGRFVAGLDPITNSAEFQKVDCAPRDTLGDGQLKVTDWVQAGRYAAGLDPLTPAGGPTGPSAPSLAKAQPNTPNPRQVTVNSGSAVKGLTMTLPINLQAQGNETALAFSLNFDPTVLRYLSATKGSAASSAALYVNANQAASGNLAIVLCLPAGGSHFNAGLDEIAQVTFEAIATATSNSVTFADQPVLRSISDTNATELTANYVGNSVVINPQPAMGISSVGATSVLSWPEWAGDFTLQAAGSLTPPITWTNVPVTLETNGDNIQIALPAPGGQTFFRLYHP